jgi:hypothetical protein
MAAVKSKYVGGSPEGPGNYIAFDLLTADQYVAKVFEGPDGGLLVLSGHDHQIHIVEEMDMPNVRWVLIEPMTKQEMDKYLAQPAL